jgi:hypothetical protein
MTYSKLLKGPVDTSMKLVFCFSLIMLFTTSSFAQAQSGEIKNGQVFLIKALGLKSNIELKILLDDFLESSNSQSLPQDFPPDYCAKNCQLIITNGSGMVLIGSEPARLKEIRSLVFEFLENPEGEVWLADSIAANYSNTTGYLSKGLIHFSFDSIANANVIAALAEALKGISDYRNTIARRYYQQEYAALNPSLQADLDAKIKSKLVLEDFIPPPPPPPPPPPVPAMMEELDEEEEEEELDWFDPPQP